MSRDGGRKGNSFTFNSLLSKTARKLHSPSPTIPHVSRQILKIFVPLCFFLHFFLIFLSLPLATHFLQPSFLPFISTRGSTQKGAEVGANVGHPKKSSSPQSSSPKRLSSVSLSLSLSPC